MSYTNPLGLRFVVPEAETIEANELLSLPLAYWVSNDAAVPESAKVALGQSSTGSRSAVAVMLLLNAALREDDAVVVIYSVNKLGMAWDASFPALVRSRIEAHAGKAYSVAAWRGFKAVFAEWRRFSSSDASQLAAQALTLVQSCRIVSTCTRTSDPLRAQGCDLLADIVACYTGLCTDEVLRASWVPAWLDDVAEWRSNCDVSMLSKAGLSPIYIYLGAALSALAPHRTDAQKTERGRDAVIGAADQCALLLRAFPQEQERLRNTTKKFQHLADYQPEADPSVRNHYTWQEAEVMQRQISRRHIPIRLHHEIFSTKDVVGRVTKVWTATHPSDENVKSLWGELDIHDPIAWRRVASGNLPECSLDLLRIPNKKPLTGLMLCQRNEAFFPGARIYPNAQESLVLGISEDPPFTTLPKFLADTMPTPSHTPEAVRQHPRFAALRALMEQADTLPEGAAKELLTKESKTIYDSIQTELSAAAVPMDVSSPASAVPATMATGFDPAQMLKQMQHMEEVFKNVQESYSKMAQAASGQRPTGLPAAKREKKSKTDIEFIEMIMETATPKTN